MKSFFGVINKVLLFFTIAFLLSGCSFDFDVNTFIKIPKPTEKYGEIQSALEKKYDANIILKLPLSDTLDDQSSINLFDDDKAAVCFKVDEKDEWTNVAIVKKIDNNWNVISVLSQQGYDVDRIFWGKLNAQDQCEVIVGWSDVSNSVKIMHAYQVCDYDVKKIEQGENFNDEKYKEFLITDIDRDGIDEILFVVQITEKSGKDAKSAQLLKCKDNKFAKISECGLREFVKYFSIKSGKVDDKHIGVFFDGYVYGQQDLITYDMVYWNNEKSELEHAKFDSEQNDLIFAQYSFEKSRDIDGDGIIEIPTSGITSWSSSDNKFLPAVLIVWKNYNVDSGRLMNDGKSTYIKNEYEGYCLYLTEKFREQSLDWQVNINKVDRSMTFLERSEKKFEIRVFPKDKWKAHENEYQLIAESESNRQVYVARYFDEIETFPIQKLKENLKIM